MFQMRILNGKFLLPKKGILDKINEKKPNSKIYHFEVLMELTI